jgi:hypothetical protein
LNSVTLRWPSIWQKRRKLPGCSGISTANSAFALGPMSARSATWRRRSKLMLAPLLIAISVAPVHDLARYVALDARHRERPGRLGDRAVVLEDVLDRAQISSVFTSTISST